MSDCPDCAGDDAELPFCVVCGTHHDGAVDAMSDLGHARFSAELARRRAARQRSTNGELLLAIGGLLALLGVALLCAPGAVGAPRGWA